MQNYSVNKAPRAVVAAGLGLIGLTSFAGAQELFGSFSDYSQASGYDLQDNALNASDQLDMFKYGVRAGVTFDDNVFLSSSDEESDVITNIDLILSLKNSDEATNSWVLTYIPSFKYYSEGTLSDGVDHNLNAGFSKVLPKTQIDLGVDYGAISGSNRYAAGQIDKTTYGADIAISHILTGKTRADLDLNMRSDDYDGALTGRDRYSARLSWLYQWSGKINLGPYVGYEYTDVERFNDHKAVSYGLSFEYQALAKTSFNGHVGGETRSFDGSGQSDKTSATFKFGTRHQYSGKTSFDAAIYRNVRPSYGANNDSFTSTGVYIGTSYAATERLKLRSRFNFERDDYFGPTSNSGDDNDYFSFSLGGDYAMPCGVKLGADVTFREKNAENGASDFSNTLFQVDATYYF